MFKAFAAVAAVCVLPFAFTACGDDEGGDEPQPTVQTPKSAMAAYNFEVSADMLEVLDITISYIDKGEKKSEKMTNTKWGHVANGLVLPATFGYKVHMKVKDNASFSKSSYDFSIKTYSTEYAVYDQDGKRIDSLSSGPSSASQGGLTGLDEERIRAAFTDREYINIGFQIGTDGKHTTATISW